MLENKKFSIDVLPPISIKSNKNAQSYKVNTYAVENTYLHSHPLTNESFPGMASRFTWIIENIDSVANLQDEINNVVSYLRQRPNDSKSIIAWFALARLHEKAKNVNQALLVYDALLEKSPNCVPAIVNKAIILEKCGRSSEAIDCLSQVTASNSDIIRALIQRARMLENSGRLPEAESVMLNILTSDPENHDVLQHYLHIRQKQCRWPIIVNHAGIPKHLQEANMGSIAAQAYMDSPRFHLTSIKNFIKRKLMPPLNTLPPIKKDSTNNKRSKIGFLSSDFRWHAVSILSVELFELIDKSKFEIFALDITPQDSNPSEFRSRVLAAFEHHVMLQELSDLDAAKTIRELGIDLLVDLNGLTANSRPQILMLKPAAVQASWLGSLATTGLSEVEYYITDAFAFTEECKPFYTESPIFLKSGAHPHDSNREIGRPKMRVEFGLPEDKFIYCCFNNSYKITENIFNIWLQILGATPNSILWLLESTESSKINLLNYADANNLKDRLIFSPRIPPSEYLIRFTAADLFLDTSPYNAGTTAIDCLYAGLPILTCPGVSVASRTCGSVLHHSNLDELIAKDWKEYESLAIEWGQNPLQFKEKFADKLSHNRLLKTPMFNTKNKTLELEEIFQNIIEKSKLADL